MRTRAPVKRLIIVWSECVKSLSSLTVSAWLRRLHVRAQRRRTRNNSNLGKDADCYGIRLRVDGGQHRVTAELDASTPPTRRKVATSSD